MITLNPRFLKVAHTLAFISTVGSTTAITSVNAESTAPTTEEAPAGENTTEPTPEALPSLTVSAPRIANHEPTGSFAMPVTALRFDPRVDVQSRNIAEAQSDVTIRGGTFENTSFSVGAVAIYDPQTGHYFAELPVSPAMLGAPQINTGAVNAQYGWNATAGNIAYAWQPITDAATASLGTGNDNLLTAEGYIGLVSPEKILNRTVALDLATAYSNGDDPVPLAGHDFERYNVRLQLRDDISQTDLFAGYQIKDFSWPNLYAGRVPGGPLREEKDALETQLYSLNHRVEFNSTDDWFQASAYFRTNRDHYSIPVFNYHAQHRTNTSGAAFDGRFTMLHDDATNTTTALRYRAGVIADHLESSELRFGNYASRTQFFAGIFADQTIPLTHISALILTAGVNYDDSNREHSAFSPVATIAWTKDDGANWLRRIRLDYAEATQVPTYTALNSAPSGFFGGDPNLGRSRSRNIEISADIAVQEWEISPAIFYRQDNDLVDWVFDPANPASNRSARAVDLDTYGIELIVRHSWQIFDLTLSYTWLHKSNDYTTPITASFYAMNFAEHRLTGAIVARLGHGLELHCDNEFRVQENNVLRSGTNTPFFTTLGIVWHIPAINGLSLAAQVDNLWDVHYEEVPLVPGTPRTWSLRATYTW